MQSMMLQFEQILVKALPSVITVIMLIFGAVLGHIPGFGRILPLLTLINIYYWCIFYPGILPYWLLFCIGLLQDTVYGLPLGFSSFINIVFAWILINHFRVFGSMTFAVIWFRFIALSAVIILLEWLIIGMYHGKMMSVFSEFLKWLSSCFAYPLIHYMLTRLYRVVHD